MDPAPRAYADLPRDAQLGVTVPFACGTPDQPPPSWRDGLPSARTLDHRRVTQCALSRVCSICGAALGRPLTFLGTAEERDRLAFHLPPAHLDCVESLLREWGPVREALGGQPAPVSSWVVLTTGGFDYNRPITGQDDRRASFAPNSVISEREHAAS